MADTEARYEIYDGVSATLGPIVDGTVCGVIAVHTLRNKGSILEYLRHDLKNLQGYDYTQSQQFIFPPCIDLVGAPQMLQIVTLMQKLQNGTYDLPDAEHFDVQEALPSLSVHMLIPHRDISIVIVDDQASFMEGMATILRAWPRISLQLINQFDVQSPMIPKKTDIALLDEMRAYGLTGSDLFQEMRRKGCKAIVASTTTGTKPAFMPYHFPRKDAVEKRREAAEAFVHFMNQLIALIPR